MFSHFIYLHFTNQMSPANSKFLALFPQTDDLQPIDHPSKTIHDINQSLQPNTHKEQTHKSHPRIVSIPPTKQWYAPPSPIPIPKKLLTNPGPQRRKIPIHALPLPRPTSSRPRHNRHIANPSPQSNYLSRINPRMRKVAWPSAQGGVPQGDQDPGPSPLRLPSSRHQ